MAQLTSQKRRRRRWGVLHSDEPEPTFSEWSVERHAVMDSEYRHCWANDSRLSCPASHCGGAGDGYRMLNRSSEKNAMAGQLQPACWAA
jgi:hypothetical protein